jgi:hypothetical protein
MEVFWCGWWAVMEVAGRPGGGGGRAGGGKGAGEDEALRLGSPHESQACSVQEASGTQTRQRR